MAAAVAVLLATPMLIVFPDFDTFARPLPVISTLPVIPNTLATFATFVKFVMSETACVCVAAAAVRSRCVSETAPVRPSTLWTGAAAAAAAVNDTTSAVECVWADGVNVAGTFDRAVNEIVGMRACENVPAVTALASCVCSSDL